MQAMKALIDPDLNGTCEHRVSETSRQAVVHVMARHVNGVAKRMAEKHNQDQTKRAGEKRSK